MFSPFYPLFKHILRSSIWCDSPHPTKFIWIALLDLADADGNVLLTLPELSSLAGVTIPEAETAITRLLAPDPDSFSASPNGAHIENITGGWRVFPAHSVMSEVEA